MNFQTREYPGTYTETVTAPLKADGANSSASSWPLPDWSIFDDRRGDLPEFPVEVFSDPCRDWIERAALGAGVTNGHVAVPLIGIASSLVGTARRVNASTSFTQPMTCWTVIAGFSGTGKTPGIDATRRALTQVERNRRTKIAEMRREHEAKIERAKAVRAAWKERLSQLADQAVVSLDQYRSTKSDAPVMPVDAVDPGPFIAPRLHVSNATIERIAQLLEVQPRGALLLVDELAGLLLNMGRYSNGTNAQFWLEAWNGGAYTVERISRPPIVLNHLLIGVSGGIQPDALARSFKGDYDGLYARFLFSWPSEPQYRPLSNDVAEVEPEILNAITRLVELDSGQSKDGGFAPIARPLSAEAVKRFEHFRQFLHAKKQGLDGHEREWWAKMPAHALRLSGTLAYLEWAMIGGPEPDVIDDRHMDAAERLLRDYFWPHARAALRQIGLTDKHKDLRRVLRWVRASGKSEVSLRDIRREALAQSVDADQTKELIRALVVAGWLRPRERDVEQEQLGRPAHRWLVNPAIWHAESAGNAETQIEVVTQ